MMITGPRDHVLITLSRNTNLWSHFLYPQLLLPAVQWLIFMEFISVTRKGDICYEDFHHGSMTFVWCHIWYNTLKFFEINHCLSPSLEVWGCCIIQVLQGLLFSFDCCFFPMDPFSDNLTTTAAIVVYCGDPKKVFPYINILL